MKTIHNSLFKYFSIIFLMAISISCGKDSENVIDCIFESAYVSIHPVADSSNPLLINFELRYTGDENLHSVEWDFGDGNQTTVNGATTTHTYASNGTYTVKALVNLRNGDARCSITEDKEVVLN